MEGNLHQVSEEASERSGDIFRNFASGSENIPHVRCCGSEAVTKIILRMIYPSQERSWGDTGKGD